VVEVEEEQLEFHAHPDERMVSDDEMDEELEVNEDQVGCV
jgi:hypothetical protein